MPDRKHDASKPGEPPDAPDLLRFETETVERLKRIVVDVDGHLPAHMESATVRQRWRMTCGPVAVGLGAFDGVPVVNRQGERIGYVRETEFGRDGAFVTVEIGRWWK